MHRGGVLSFCVIFILLNLMREFYKLYLSLFIKVIILLIAIVIQLVPYVLSVYFVDLLFFALFCGLNILCLFVSFVD